MSTGPITQFCTSDNPSTLPIAEHVAQFFVAHLGQRRIHHHDQADGDWDVRGPDAEAIDETAMPGTRYPMPTPSAIARKIHTVR